MFSYAKHHRQVSVFHENNAKDDLSQSGEQIQP